ncbi:hypothetical protein ACIQD3_06425 [Peribacillus loiseleuriae]|uniref:hypothetical protein n=1 Tax=Peribacillus loiseleuriae TaxID=1679170 RepID=UPI00380D2303
MSLILSFLILFIPIILALIFRKNRKVLIGALAVPFLVILLLCGWIVYEKNYQFVKSTDLTNESIGDINLRDAISNHKMKRSFHVGDNVYYQTYLTSPRLTLGANENDEVIFISTNLKNLQTQKQIQVSTPLQVVIEKYGEHYYKGRDMGMGEYIGYLDKPSKKTLLFWHEKGKVTEIEFKLIKNGN